MTWPTRSSRTIGRLGDTHLRSVPSLRRFGVSASSTWHFTFVQVLFLVVWPFVLYRRLWLGCYRSQSCSVCRVILQDCYCNAVTYDTYRLARRALGGCVGLSAILRALFGESSFAGAGRPGLFLTLFRIYGQGSEKGIFRSSHWSEKCPASLCWSEKCPTR